MNADDPRDRHDTVSGKESEDDLSARLKRLGSDLDAKRRSASSEEAGRVVSSSDTKAVGQAFRLSAEFVAGVIAGGVVGWLVDRLVGSSPWGLIVFLILGFCAGMLNLLRASGTLKPARQADTTSKRP